MPDYIITVPAGSMNKGLKRDARKSNITPEAMLRAWLESNLQDAARRYDEVVAQRTAEAFATAADTATIAEVKASIVAPEDDPVDPPVVP